VSTTILGISAFYHDSAAALLRDGEIIAAAQEERFSRKKHDPRFPTHAVNYCMEEAMVETGDLDAVVFYDNPLLTWDRVVKNAAEAGPAGREQFLDATRSILGIKLWVRDYVESVLGGLGREGRLLFSEHHMAHAASAFFPSPFDEAAIISIDGVGEWTTTALGFGHDAAVELYKEIHYPHSVGLLYSAFTYYCGFKVNSGEYKLMGLAPYGEPKYADRIRDKLIDIKADGSFCLNTDYFAYLHSHVMTSEAFHDLFGGPPRKPETLITQKDADLAASVQVVTEEIVLKLGATARRETGAKNCVMAGGVALNCVANGKLLEAGTFENLWIQPAAGDAGGALGAAYMVHHHYYGLPRHKNPTGRDTQKGSYLGPAFSSVEVRAFLDRNEYPYRRIEDEDARIDEVARAIADQKIIGLLQGRMEYGPRALGARSIIGDPRSRETQSVMNLKIKYRESFRPFAPSVLHEDVSEFFEMTAESPYMLLVAPVKESRRLYPEKARMSDTGEDMREIINQPRSDVPAITHVDHSARVQTVHPEDNAEYYKLIRRFKELTGYGIVVNTSFNVRGEPIVCTPKDAYLCFMRTEMDLLVLEDCILLKEDQPQMHEEKDWRETYELD
jgi:carbamoyltransferase